MYRSIASVNSSAAYSPCCRAALDGVSAAILKCSAAIYGTVAALSSTATIPPREKKKIAPSTLRAAHKRRGEGGRPVLPQMSWSMSEEEETRSGRTTSARVLLDRTPPS